MLSRLHFAVGSLLFPIYSLKCTYITYMPFVLTRRLGQKRGAILVSTFLRGCKPDRISLKLKFVKRGYTVY